MEPRLLLSGYVLGDLASVAPAPAGYSPRAALMRDPAGDLFGTTQSGGAYNMGTVFEIPAGPGGAGTGTLTTIASFHGPDGASPYAAVTLDSSGNLFGTTSSGGASNAGTLFEIAKGGNTVTTLASFDRTNGSAPQSPLLLDAAGDLFGTTTGGGTKNDGSVFEVAAGSTSVTFLASFLPATGTVPTGDLAMDSSGDLFGTALDGGDANNDGTVWELAAGTNTVTAVALFNGTNGHSPLGGVVMDPSGNLFGTTQLGGTSGRGTVFEVAKGSAGGTGAVTTLASFQSTDGAAPNGSVTFDAAGNLYGTTSSGGNGGGIGGQGYGTVFTLPKGGNTITTLASFTGANGQDPVADVTFDAAGNLFGTTNMGGPLLNGRGTVFEIPAAAGGGTALNTLYTFQTPDGKGPQGVTLDASGNLFGTYTSAGPFLDGEVYEVAGGSHLLTTLTTFSTDEAFPQGGVTPDAAGNLFGSTQAGGINSEGAVYEIAKGSNTPTLLASFTHTDALVPVGDVAVDAAGDVFGTSGGGAYQYGAVYEVAAGTGAVTTVASFNFSNGVLPQSVVLDDAGNLFGASAQGGANGRGVVYEIANGTSAATALASFSLTDGQSPVGRVVLDAAGDVFGVASSGGNASNQGTVFEVAQGTRAVTALALFNGTNGANPASIAIDASGNLFGTATNGGVNNDGTVWELPKGSNALTAIALFNDGYPSSGSHPQGDLAIDAAGNLYGTVPAGGAANTGAVFEVYQPAKLAFLQPPTGGAAGAPLSPAVTVAVQDSLNNTIPADASTVTLTLTGPGGAAGGTFADGTTTATATAVNGVATFPNLVINSPGDYTLTASDSSYSLSTAPVPFSVSSSPTTVQAVGFSDGSSTTGQAQRSQVRQLIVTYTSPATLTPSQLSLGLLNSGGSGKNDDSAPTPLTGVLGTPAPVAGTNDTTWVVPVLANTPYTDGTGSLGDGIYTLAVGNPSGVGVTSLTFHRLFGDVDGNKTVNAFDYARFKTAFGTSGGAAGYNADLDFDGSGTINALDYAQFKKRFGFTFTYTSP